MACRDAENTAAADPPRVEVKAAVAPFEGVTVVSPIEGTIAELRVAEGTAVQQGDVLATLTNPGVERDLAYARAAILAAEHRLRSAGAPRAQARPASRSNIERERVAASIVKQKQQRLDRLRALLATGDVARQEVENAEAELAAATRDLDAERDRAATPVAIEAAADTSLLRAELDRARADLAFAEHRKSQLVIKAPASGAVTRLRIAAGADVYTRDPVAEIVDSTSARVQAQLAPELLRFVQAGRPVDVKLMTIPPRRYREPIARVNPPGAEGGASIVVQVPNPDRMLQPGTPAVITIP